MVAFRYATVNCKIMTLVLHASFSTHSPPWCGNEAYSHAQPHPENERQQSVNDIWSCIFGNMSGAWSQSSIKKDMAACVGRYVQYILATSSGTVTTYFIYRATTKYSWALWHIVTVKMMYIDNNHHIALWLPMMKGQQSLTLCWRAFWRWGRKRFTFIFAYKGSQLSVYDNVQPVAPQISHHTCPTIVDAPLTFIFMIGQGGYCTVFCL